MKKRLSQALITSIVVSTFIISTVLASPQDDVDALESQKAQAEAEAESVNQSLVDLLVDYEALKQDMDNQEKKIDQASQELKEAQAEEQQQYEDMKLRIKYMYEEGDTNFIQILLTSESFSELLSKSEYVDKVYNYDREKLADYVEITQEVEDLKTTLEGEEADMEDMAVEMEAQQASLQSTLDTMREEISDFDAQLAEAEEAAARELEEAQAAVEEAQEEEAAETEEPKKEKSETEEAPKKTEETKQESSEKKSSASGSSSSKSSGSSSSSKSETSSGSSSSASASNAALGQQIADKACEYIGGKYVYGGTSLTSGVDCSGFVQQIHKLFGISTPRTSTAIRGGGKAVAYADKLPGDVICYSGHVAIYIGNNTIVHASNSAPYPAGGIKTTTPANYKNVLAVRRYW